MFSSIYHRVRTAYLAYIRPIARDTIQETYPYRAGNFWDHWWYDADIHARYSVEPDGADSLATEIHYAALETAIALACHRHGIERERATVLDVGTGTGRWIDYYLEHGATAVHAVDISQHSISGIAQRYTDESDVLLEVADIAEGIDREAHSIDILNAIGVMFHVTEESRFDAALGEISRLLDRYGYAFITGRVGLFSYNRKLQDTGDDQPPEVFKRLRSRREWNRRLADAGLELVEVIDTPGFVDVDTPENRLMVIRRSV